MTDFWTQALNAAIQVLTLALGVLGTIAFYWQFLQRRAKRIRFLNRSVLRLWSKVELKHRPRSVEGRPAEALWLSIPKDAVPDDVDPTVGEDGLDVKDLPGLSDGKRFLRSPHLSHWTTSQRALRVLCHRASRGWEEVVEARGRYEEARERRRAALESMIARDMAATYPELRPVPYHEVALNTYVKASLLARMEDESDYSLQPGWTGPYLQPSQYSGENGGYAEISDGYLLMRISRKYDPDASAFRKVFISWVESVAVKDAAREMARHSDQIAAALGQFRGIMRDITFGIDLEFRPEE